MTSTPTSGVSAVGPVLAEAGTVRLRLHARELRGDRSIADAAASVGLNRDELSRIERGETSQIRFETIAKLLSGYGCSLSDLLETEIVDVISQVPRYVYVLEVLGAEARPTMVGRRAVRRDDDADLVAEADETLFAGTRQGPTARRRRAPLGTSSR